MPIEAQILKVVMKDRKRYWQILYTEGLEFVYRTARKQMVVFCLPKGYFNFVEVPHDLYLPRVQVYSVKEPVK